MNDQFSLDEFLNKKRDYSPFLVHLTKDCKDEQSNSLKPARDVLSLILNCKSLRAFNHFCYFSPSIAASNDNKLQDRFKVVCFTETPIDQIDLLLSEVIERDFKPKPYGLVFTKDYIRSKRGNPVFYIIKEIAKPLWSPLYERLRKKELSEEVCVPLALMTVCEEGNDWHWEREWRIVGDLKFELSDIYCVLCPEEEIALFEKRYSDVIFISPIWGTNKILDKLVKTPKKNQSPAYDIPF
jgi:hypothetical protein